ncbi:amidase domain-containing protein [Frondihabitans sp. 762G35]|uniref:amidase domain-containing protein n=1 Tax=Frondihabitans sp. 762G35 TaxID=1446794 RepID=UPI0013DC0364|nr:amidase domain-containing protein [Frondihabitans sp. 762G35]
MATLAAMTLVAGCSAGGSGTGSLGETSIGQGTPRPSAATSGVVAIAPASGSVVGGQSVTLTGTGLTGVDRVTFDGVAASRVTVAGSTRVTAVVPQAVDFQPATAVVKVFRGSTEVRAASADGLSYGWTVTTGVDREMQYAFAHWRTASYNPAYYDFNAVGGDCQNFVSQSLAAAGLPQTDDWFYRSQSAHSESWGYAPTFDDHLEDTPSLGFTKRTDAQRSQLRIGDLAYFDWNHNGVPDHVMIVSGVSTVDGKTTVKLVGHNLDADYRDLDVAITKDHPGSTVWFYTLPASLR